MANYVGVKCPVCNKRFAPAEDIVVCPVCGAPHHRHCYDEKDACAFAADHLSGKEWHHPGCGSSVEEEGGGPSSEGRVRNCLKCGSANPRDALFCQVCGNQMMPGSRFGESAQSLGQDIFPGYGAFGADDPFGGVDGNEQIAGFSVSDLALFINSNSFYYIPRFHAAAKSGRRVSFNFAAFFFNFFYYFYRKMYLIGGILLGIYIAGLIPFFLFAVEIMPEILYQYGAISAYGVLNEGLINLYAYITSVAWGVITIVNLACSFFANYFYYKQVIRQMGKLAQEKERFAEQESYDYQHVLASSGGVDKLSVILLVAILFIAFSFVNSAIVYYFMNAGGIM